MLCTRILLGELNFFFSSLLYSYPCKLYLYFIKSKKEVWIVKKQMLLRFLIRTIFIGIILLLYVFLDKKFSNLYVNFIIILGGLLIIQLIDKQLKNKN